MRAYLDAKTQRRHGWQSDLVKRSGVQRQTITKWTHPDYDGYPDLDSLAALAEALGVRPYEVVAAIDGDQRRDARGVGDVSGVSGCDKDVGGRGPRRSARASATTSLISVSRRGSMTGRGTVWPPHSPRPPRWMSAPRMSLGCASCPRTGSGQGIPRVNGP